MKKNILSGRGVLVRDFLEKVNETDGFVAINTGDRIGIHRGTNAKEAKGTTPIFTRL